MHRRSALPLADSLGGVPLLQSWAAVSGMVWASDAVLMSLRREDGEAGIITDDD